MAVQLQEAKLYRQQILERVKVFKPSVQQGIRDFLSVYIRPNLDCTNCACWIYGNGDSQRIQYEPEEMDIFRYPDDLQDGWCVLFDNKEEIITLNFKRRTATYPMDSGKNAAIAFLSNIGCEFSPTSYATHGQVVG